MPNDLFGIGITGLGKCLPKNKVSSETLAKKLRVSTDWIIKSSGIKSRYFISAGESASLLSLKASKQALKSADLKPKQIDMILTCTFSGDYLFPAVACKIQHLLKAEHALAFDISAGSVGFQIAINIAQDKLKSDPSAKHILVIATAVQSRYLNWKNPKVSILFGDGSGAAVISKIQKNYGIIASTFFSDGAAYDTVCLKGGGSNYPSREQFIEMDGAKVGKVFLKQQSVVIEQVLQKANLDISEVNWFIFHQANLRLIQFLTTRMNIPMKKTFVNVDRIGNTSDASLAIALCEAQEQGLLKRGQIVVLSGVGPGCTFGATAFRWY